jgi:hypothetical protein
VTSEPLHETGITVPATMTASDIRVNTVVKTGNSRFGQNGLGKDFPDFHINYYNGVVNKSKGFLLFFPYWLRRIKAGKGKFLTEEEYNGSFYKFEQHAANQLLRFLKLLL